MNKQHLEEWWRLKSWKKNKNKKTLPIGKVEALFDLILHSKEPWKPLKIGEVISKVTHILKGQ